MKTTNADLFKDQYFEINLATAKILTKKKRNNIFRIFNSH